MPTVWWISQTERHRLRPLLFPCLAHAARTGGSTHRTPLGLPARFQSCPPGCLHTVFQRRYRHGSRVSPAFRSRCNGIAKPNFGTRCVHLRKVRPLDRTTPYERGSSDVPQDRDRPRRDHRSKRKRPTALPDGSSKAPPILATARELAPKPSFLFSIKSRRGFPPFMQTSRSKRI